MWRLWVKIHSRMIMLWLFVTLVLLASSFPAMAQGNPPAALFRPEEIEQLVAPIALYPDALLAQILMASNYPLSKQYRDSVSQQKYNRTTRTSGDAREAFRGRAESGRQQLAHGGAQGVGSNIGTGRTGAERTSRPDASRFTEQQGGQARQQTVIRDRQDGGRGREAQAYQGLGSGREVQRDSNRGRASLQSAAASRAASTSGGGHFGGTSGGGRGGGFRGR